MAMRTAIIIFVLILLGYLFMDYNTRASQYNQLLAERERVSAEKAVREETKVALQTQIAYATSANAVREYGYTNRQYQEGDVPVVVYNPLVSTPTPPPEPTHTTVETSHIEQWLSLFIDPPLAAPDNPN
jgi:hypothetical protein